MSSIAALYNSLPSVEAANSMFIDREQIFEELGALLAKYGNQYGVTLVHAHCRIDHDEIMLFDGNDTTAPHPAVDGVYADRWLATGQGFEFTQEPTPSPPAGLLADFKMIVTDLPLGLFFIRNPDKGLVTLERTVGRKNVTTAIPTEDTSLIPKRSIQTGWLPGGVAPPVQLWCASWCSSSADDRHTTAPEHDARSDQGGIRLLVT